MARRVQTRRPEAPASILPTERRAPINDPWQYSYLIHGEKKIGKSSLAIAGEVEELVFQWDKPQLAYEIREVVCRDWRTFLKGLKEVETACAALADGEKPPWQRIIIDGVGEWYDACMAEVCRPQGIEDPSEADDYGKTWRRLKARFNDAVTRLLTLQNHGVGVVFICHSEWKERDTRGGGKIRRLEPMLATRCEEIVNGKVDAWFAYDYHGSSRVLVTQGAADTGAGHRIDGHFLTPDGRRIAEIPMGSSADEAMHNFLEAFHNRQAFINLAERDGGSATGNKGRRAVRRK